MFQGKKLIALLRVEIRFLSEGTFNCEFVCETIVLKLLQYFEDKIWIIEKWTFWERSHYYSCCKMIKDGKNQFPHFAENVQVLKVYELISRLLLCSAVIENSAILISLAQFFMALLMIVVSVQNSCRFSHEIEFLNFSLVNFKNRSFFSEGTQYCEFVCMPIAFILKYVFEDYFWRIEISTN